MKTLKILDWVHLYIVCCYEIYFIVAFNKVKIVSCKKVHFCSNFSDRLLKIVNCSVVQTI